MVLPSHSEVVITVINGGLGLVVGKISSEDTRYLVVRLIKLCSRLRWKASTYLPLLYVKWGIENLIKAITLNGRGKAMSGKNVLTRNVNSEASRKLISRHQLVCFEVLNMYMHRASTDRSSSISNFSGYVCIWGGGYVAPHSFSHLKW